MKNLKNLIAIIIAAFFPLSVFAASGDASSCISLKAEIQANPKVACIYYAAICPSLCSAPGVSGSTGSTAAATSAATTPAATTPAATTAATTKASSGATATATASKNCVDATTLCLVYAAYGYCNTLIGYQPLEYYKTMCPQSCGSCGSATAATT